MENGSSAPSQGRMQAFKVRLKSAGQEIAVFGSLAWPGAAIGSAAVLVLFMAYMGSFLRSGLGRAVDIAASALLGALGLAVVGLLLMLVVTILRILPRLLTGASLGVIACFLLLSLARGGPPELLLRMGGTLVLLFLTLGGAVTVVVRGGARKAL